MATLDCSGGNASAPFQVALIPRYGEYPTTMRARQLERKTTDRRPTLTRGAHRVARAPVARQVDGIGRTRDHGPAGRLGEHRFQQASEHRNLLIRHSKHELVSSQSDDTVPSAASQCTVDIDAQAGPGPRLGFEGSSHYPGCSRPPPPRKPPAQGGGGRGG